MRSYFTLCLLLLLFGCSDSSPTGRGQTLLYSDEQMRQLGAESFAQIKQQESVSRDQAMNRYVQCVANALTKPAVVTQVDAAQQEQWEVVVFESDQINAFALPGGHIGVYSGLLNVAKNQDQLAAVIGHEIAHVLADHSNEQVSRNQITNTGLGVAEAALGAFGVESQGLIMTGLGLGAQLGVALPYGRLQESEADEIGLKLMAIAGFNPSASVQLWLNMAKTSSGAPPELLSTHPSHDTRIDDLRQWQKQARMLYQQAQQAGRKPDCQLRS